MENRRNEGLSISLEASAPLNALHSLAVEVKRGEGKGGKTMSGGKLKKRRMEGEQRRREEKL